MFRAAFSFATAVRSVKCKFLKVYKQADKTVVYIFCLFNAYNFAGFDLLFRFALDIRSQKNG